MGPIRSLRQFDDKIVARYCGFRDAADYYYRAASARVVDRIAVPALVLRALDDPFIRLTPETRAAIVANPQITLVETPHGGHCAYLCRTRAMRFTGPNPPSSATWCRSPASPMEADWEVEIGVDAPVIDVGWPGFVDLRASPGSRDDALLKLHILPVLADALIRLNAPSSPVSTSKCDVWKVEEFDPDEFEASTRDAIEAMACYIDILAAQPAMWTSPETAVAWARGICDRCTAIHCPCCRADLVVRRAIIDQAIA